MKDHTSTTEAYIDQSLVGHWHKLPYSQPELLAGRDDNKQETALKWDRRAHPVAPPSGMSHTLGLQHFTVAFIIFMILTRYGS
jgi:hypothetical protein